MNDGLGPSPDPGFWTGLLCGLVISICLWALILTGLGYVLT